MDHGWPTSLTDPLCLGKHVSKSPDQDLKLSQYSKSLWFLSISYFPTNKLAKLFLLYTENTELTETAKICGSGILSEGTVRYFHLWTLNKFTLRLQTPQLLKENSDIISKFICKMFPRIFTDWTVKIDLKFAFLSYKFNCQL